MPSVPRPRPANANCAMCHHPYARTEYCDEDHIPSFQSAGERRTYLVVQSAGRMADSHMHRICQHCGYEWTEPVE